MRPPRLTLIFFLGLLILQPLAAGGAISRFQNGDAQVISILSAPDYNATVRISVPTGCYVRNASMRVTGMPEQGEYPLAPEVMFNETCIWAFNGKGYGALGKQSWFLDGTNKSVMEFGAAGGTQGKTIRLPKNAIVQNASLGVAANGTVDVKQLMEFHGVHGADYFGGSVSDAGDVNGDGYCDLIVGAIYSDEGGIETGGAYLYFCGPGADNNPDLIFPGATHDDRFGISVSGAGDVNGDGYSDVIIGADANDTNGGWSGSVYIYFGGLAMDRNADVIIKGLTASEALGFSVSSAGDVNNDGYDDVIAGADQSNVGGNHRGRAFIYFGGSPMNNVPDVWLPGAAAGDYFGYSVSGVGDVNNDSYDDVIVGAYASSSKGLETGSAYLYLGGASMDNNTDAIFVGEAAGDRFGYSVSGAGDVNGDGFDDAIVGALYNDAAGFNAGRAYVFYGNNSMDTMPDITFSGMKKESWFGISVSGAGDVSGDGYDDVIVSATNDTAYSTQAGMVYVYLGGPFMDSNADVRLPPNATDFNYGSSVSTAGDVNGDGCDEVVVGTIWGNLAIGNTRTHSIKVGISNPELKVGTTSIWKSSGSVNGSFRVGNFSNVLNNYLRATAPKATDSYNNSYVDVPMSVSVKSNGTVMLSDMDITYQYYPRVLDFSKLLNEYIAAHRGQEDADGNITIPINISSEGAGRILLGDLWIRTDDAPTLLKYFPTFYLNEDTMDSRLIDLRDFFMDDYDSFETLNMTVSPESGFDPLEILVADDGYISVDASTGNKTDNWTGSIRLSVRCADSHGSTTVSNMFKIEIVNVNDPPLITSQPPLAAVSGIDYIYQLTTVDGDNDSLTFILSSSPENMWVSAEGCITWTPKRGGMFSVSVAASDGQEEAVQDFTINVANHPPTFINSPITNATIGKLYSYTAIAMDEDGDALAFSLLTKPENMTVTPNGRINWIPSIGGQLDVVLGVSDGRATTLQQFVIEVNWLPKITSNPTIKAISGVPYYYLVQAMDEDGGVLTYNLTKDPSGMDIDASTGMISWAPIAAQVGKHNVTIIVDDGQGGSAEQSFIVTVEPPVRPGCKILEPSNRTTVEGKIRIAGSATCGTFDLSKVEVRMDRGNWTLADGKQNWSLEIDTRSIENGKHRIETRSYDGTGYSNVSAIEITVDNKKSQVGDGQSGSINEMMLAAGILIVIAIAVILLILVVNRKKKG